MQTPAQPAGRDYPVQPVPFTAVRLTDDFWHPRIEVNRTITIPHAFKKSEESGRMWDFERAAMALRGETFADLRAPGFPFDDTDPYKIIEGAAYVLSVQPDASLEGYVDALIEKIAAAQEPDGYLFATRTLNPHRPHSWAGEHRWDWEKRNSHELYNAGHLYEAAAAYFHATGKRRLLDIAMRNADLLNRTFGPGRRSIWPGHQITEMGLVKLYRISGDARYLNLAKFLLDERGAGPEPGAGREYNQSHLPVTKQTTAVGHAVRAGYMYAGMADVAALTGDESYIRALGAIWNDVVTRKLYLTGGIGARHRGEEFGDAYELPNLTAYCETCAAIANVYWNHRMFLLHGDGQYIDVMERSLYNNVLSGASLDGRSFFYPNPLESDGRHQRSEWFGCACCPSNLTRFLASVPGYVYARRANDVFVNLYVRGTANLGHVALSQDTNHPWDGQVKIKLDPSTREEFAIHLRVPGWARGQAVPGDLYHYVDPASPAVALRVNGQTIPASIERGFVRVSRAWTRGDSIELDLPMIPRRVVAHENVAENRGKVALERGPIVYCAEWPEHPGKSVREIPLADDAPIDCQHRPELLGSVSVLRAGEITAIPYSTWANRGSGEMAVWLRRK